MLSLLAIVLLLSPFSSSPAPERSLSGKVVAVDYVDAVNYVWPKRSVDRKFGSIFAVATLESGECVLIGPASAEAVSLGSTVKGLSAQDMMREWPAKILSTYPRCVPLASVKVWTSLD